MDPRPASLRGLRVSGTVHVRYFAARPRAPPEGGADRRGPVRPLQPRPLCRPTRRTIRSCRWAWWRRARSRRPGRAIAIAREEGVPVTPRGGGTSQCGQTINTSLIVDCSKYLDQGDRARRRRPPLRGRAGHRARRTQPPAQAARPVVSGRHLDRLARHHRRHGRQQFLRRALAALRQHPRERHFRRCAAAGRQRVHFGPIAPDLSDVPEALKPLARDLMEIGAREAGDGQGALPAGAAPRRRLQSRRARARQERRQPRAYPGRLRRHARLLDQDRAQALAAARPPRGRRVPLRQFPERDGGGAAHRQARADCGRAHRPHHARPRARHRDVPADHQCGGARRSGGDPVRRVRRGRARARISAGCCGSPS